MSPSCCHFSAGPLCAKEKEFHCPQGGTGGPRAEKRNLFGPCIAVHVVTGQVSSSSCRCEGKFRGDSPVHIKLPALKGHFQSDTWTRSRLLGRGRDEAIFSEKKGFSVKRGEAFSE